MAKLSAEEKERRAAARQRKAALAAEEDALRKEAKHREWDANGARLTLAEIEAGVHCRGCGLAVIDGLGGRPPLMRMTDLERREYEVSEAAFKARHPDCRSHRWSMSGSRTTHCGFCCPPPPLSEKQIEAISEILGRHRPNPDELDTWQLTLTCDHTIDKTQHSSHIYWSSSTAACPTCQQTRGIVRSEKLPPDAIRQAAEDRRLAVEIETAQRKHERLQKSAEAARRRLEKLMGERRDLRGNS